MAAAIWMKVVLIFGIFGHLHGELFTALVDLKKILEAQREIVSHINSYLESEEKRLSKIQHYASQFENMSADGLKDAEAFLSNPVNAYLVVKRLTADWDDFQSLLKQDKNAQQFSASVASISESFPKQEDLEGAVQALFRLQDTYRLDAADIARGEILGKKSAPSLTSADCFELGRQSYVKADHYHTRMWMTEALARYENEMNKTTERSDILEYLAYSTYMQGNTRTALKMTNELLEILPDHKRAAGNKAHYEYVLREERSSQKRGDDGVATDSGAPFTRPFENDRVPERENYEKLCRQPKPMSTARWSKQKCFYTRGAKRWHPLLLIQPHKVEEAFDSPYVLRYHDIVTDAEIEIIKNLAKPRLQRATARNHVTGKFEPVNYRISKSAWLKPSEHRVISSLFTRVDALTNLNMDSSEDLQVVNYGIGGHYDPHYDYARKEETNAFRTFGKGNRIATVLFYLSDVDAGGATVFPIVGARLLPMKGTAVFWWNLLKSSDGDSSTRHAACPVLVGSKWVSNFWVHERGQEFRHPCGLRENEVFGRQKASWV